ncbi:DUF6415 family natural product biosynthesis protein [Streptomyces sp. NPDC005345]|uniref:DUF6415 family natural product biosynthesis protein n=1 Tax=Streptomyces sp. NPDC005345 TaxID=3156877 RepID=UPI0033BB11F2
MRIERTVTLEGHGEATATNTVDVLVMRQTIALVLPAEDELPAGLDVDTLTETLRGHMELIVPEVETKALALHKEDIPRYCALACVSQANDKLRAAPPH